MLSFWHFQTTTKACGRADSRIPDQVVPLLFRPCPVFARWSNAWHHPWLRKVLFVLCHVIVSWPVRVIWAHVQFAVCVCVSCLCGAHCLLTSCLCCPLLFFFQAVLYFTGEAIQDDDYDEDEEVSCGLHRSTVCCFDAESSNSPVLVTLLLLLHFLFVVAVW